MAVVCSGSGCAEPERATLVARSGCGVDGGALTVLRVQTRGDFPAGADTQVLVEEGTSLVGRDVGDVAAITVEGVVGDSFSGVGRTSRLHATGEIPVYFAAIDQLCAVDNDGAILFRNPGAMAVAERGDVVIVGGRDAEGQLLADIVHLTDEQGRPRLLGQRLPEAATGQSVHAVGPRAFLVVGGAGEGSAALPSVVRLGFGAGGEVDIGAPVPIEVPMQFEQGRAFHGAVRQLDGAVLVTGGCSQVAAGACDPAETSVLATSFRVEMKGQAPVFTRGPPLLSPRYGHTLHVARDGVVFAVGGSGASGAVSLAIDMLAPGSGLWVPYGPPLTSELPDTATIEGSALLEGGLLVLAINDGSLRWVNAEETGVFEGWCDPEDDDDTAPCFKDQIVPKEEGGKARVVPEPPVMDDTEQGRPPGPRPLLALPGERILADHFLLPVGGLGQTGADALDLSMLSSGSVASPPAQRTGGQSLLLADGTVLLAGGLLPGAQEPLLPLTLRLRPALDGADERIPEVDVLAPGSFVAVQPDRVALDGDSIRFTSGGGVVRFPVVRARVRGFRSRSFRFEVTLSASAASPHVVLEAGAVAGLSVRFDPDFVRGSFRDASGTSVDFSCGALPAGFWDRAQTLQIVVRPDAFVVSQGNKTLVQCPAPQLDLPVSVGVGASGSGSVTASAMRLTRI